MPQQPLEEGTLSLEQAWHFLMTQWAYRNPGKIFQANLARKALRDIKRGRARIH